MTSPVEELVRARELRENVCSHMKSLHVASETVTAAEPIPTIVTLKNNDVFSSYVTSESVIND